MASEHSHRNGTMPIRRKPLPQTSQFKNEHLEIPQPRSRSLSPSKSLPVLKSPGTYADPYSFSEESRKAIFRSKEPSLGGQFEPSLSYIQSPTGFTSPEIDSNEDAWESTSQQTQTYATRLESQASTISEESESFELNEDPLCNTSNKPGNTTTSKAKLKLVTALEDTSLFLGGLIKHPVESTKHFTILRHSHGLVYYKGPNTSISISIFSSQPIPPLHRYWLQSKGWTGNTGMAAKAFFRANNNWINVTPDVQADASEVPPLDERAWQRDIKKFSSKASKSQRKHVLRQTVIVRIPFEANDGYFRIVLTGSDSRQVLCPSPVFRIASTSMSASSLKGASLSALPVELGVKVAQFAAKSAINTAVAPFANTITSQISNAVPYSGYVKTAWNASNVTGRVENINQKYEERQTLAEEQKEFSTTRTNANNLSSVGGEDGPEDPFPIQLKGLVAQGTGESTTRLGTPTANLDSIPPDLLAFLGIGHYFGWAFVLPRDQGQREMHLEWRQAVVTILHKQSSLPQVAQRKVVRVYLIHDFPPDSSFVGAKMSLLIMGYLRPLAKSNDRELALTEAVTDVTITRASLSRSAWGHKQTFQRVEFLQRARSKTDKLVDLRAAGQRQVDRVPVHMLGVRSNTFGVHDRGIYGNGGLWIKRD